MSKNISSRESKLYNWPSARNKWLLFLANEISFKINWEQWKKHRSQYQKHIFNFFEGSGKNLIFIPWDSEVLLVVIKTSLDPIILK